MNATSVSQLFAQPFCSGADHRKHQSSALPGYWPFVRGIHPRPVNSPHKGSVTRKKLSFVDVIMIVPMASLGPWRHIYIIWLTDHYHQQRVQDVLCVRQERAESCHGSWKVCWLWLQKKWVLAIAQVWLFLKNTAISLLGASNNKSWLIGLHTATHNVLLEEVRWRWDVDSTFICVLLNYARSHSANQVLKSAMIKPFGHHLFWPDSFMKKKTFVSIQVNVNSSP